LQTAHTVLLYVRAGLINV